MLHREELQDEARTLKNVVYCTANHVASEQPTWIAALQAVPTVIVFDVGSPTPVELLKAAPSPVKSTEVVTALRLDPALVKPHAEVIKKLEAGEFQVSASSTTFRDLYWLLRSDVVFADFTRPGYGQALFDVAIAFGCGIPVIAVNTGTYTPAHVVERAFAIVAPSGVRDILSMLQARLTHASDSEVR